MKSYLEYIKENTISGSTITTSSTPPSSTLSTVEKKPKTPSANMAVTKENIPFINNVKIMTHNNIQKIKKVHNIVIKKPQTQEF